MSWIWMIGSIWYYFKWEKKNKNANTYPPLKEFPGVSIIIPCFNEEANLRETLQYALATNYPKFEVIAVNDGSKDNTGKILDELEKHYPKLRIIHLATNQGKAIALNCGAMVAKYEYLVCIDGDALLHPNAVAWLIFHLSYWPRVGAVTGNPRIINRSSLLGKLQVGEFSSIIGLIKRAQRVYGRIFTVSGVIAGFKKSALHRIGYWNEEMITEDIDVSWRLQIDHWDVRYEPNALCYIYMPETLKGLWKQRVRWAQGGVEVIKLHLTSLLSWKKRRFWAIAIEYAASVLWAYCMFFFFLVYFLGLLITLPPEIKVNNILPQWHGLMLGSTCLIQFLISLILDRRYEPSAKFLLNYLWIIWYPFAFWLLNMLTTVAAFPKAIFKKSGTRARWTSPDRGLR